MAANFYNPATYTRNDSIGWLLRKLKASIVQQAELRLGRHGLTHAQWGPLLILKLGGSCSTAHLVRELDTDAGALTRLLDRLEAKDLVKRERSSEDRRVVMVALTEAGQALTANLSEVLSDVFNAHLDGFSHEEWRLLLSLLHRMLANGDALRAAQNPQP